MRPLTVETVYRNGLIELPANMKFNQSMRVLVVFIEELNSKPKLKHQFSFSKSLELTKNCKGTISDLLVEERRNEKW